MSRQSQVRACLQSQVSGQLPSPVWNLDLVRRFIFPQKYLHIQHQFEEREYWINIINHLVFSVSSYYWMCWMTWIGIRIVFSGELDLEKDSDSQEEYQD